LRTTPSFITTVVQNEFEDNKVDVRR